MEVEGVEGLPLMDVLVHRRENGRLGRKVYQKQTHPDSYLHGASCHHLAQKLVILATHIRRAQVVSDYLSLAAELNHLQLVS